MRVSLLWMSLCVTLALRLASPALNTKLKPSTNVKLVFEDAVRSKHYKFVGDTTIWKSMDFTAGSNGVTLNVRTPSYEGLHTLQWDNLIVKLEVTCSDGDICNGQERWIGGKCKSAPRALCDDLDPCTFDTCDCKGVCTNKRINVSDPKCRDCTANAEPTCAVGAQCGSDGVGGTCGNGCSVSQRCNAGFCESCGGLSNCAEASGTCGHPIDLTSQASSRGWEGKWEVNGDNRQGVDQVKPICNPTSPATELVYLLTNKGSFTGMEVRMVSQEGTVLEGEAPLDTLLELLEVPVGMDPTKACFDHRREWIKACSDDAYPPGDSQSRVSYTLKANQQYLLIADAYSLEQTGKFTLQFSMHAAGCTPACESKFCGNDGCGGSCGDCAPTEKCDLISGISTKCVPLVCKRNCTGHVCGDDGCGGSCGSCNAAKYESCVEKAPVNCSSKDACEKVNVCQVFPPCDPLVPKCTYTEGVGKSARIREGCPNNNFCASDCKCHHEDESFPDIIMDEYHVDPYLAKVTISAQSCIVGEGYAPPGFHRLLKFATNVGNQGRATYTAPPSAENPQIFEFAPCHGHYHFRSFIKWRLLDVTGKQVANTSKFSYCIEDSYRMVKKEGNNVPCSGSSDCENQGLNVGWFDTYPATVDGQFIIVDGIPDGHYILEQCANVARRIVELSTENNCIYTEVFIGNWDTVLSED